MELNKIGALFNVDISEDDSMSNKKRLDRLQIRHSKLLQVREALIQ